MKQSCLCSQLFACAYIVSSTGDAAVDGLVRFPYAHQSAQRQQDKVAIAEMKMNNVGAEREQQADYLLEVLYCVNVGGRRDACGGDAVFLQVCQIGFRTDWTLVNKRKVVLRA